MSSTPDTYASGNNGPGSRHDGVQPGSPDSVGDRPVDTRTGSSPESTTSGSNETPMTRPVARRRRNRRDPAERSDHARPPASELAADERPVAIEAARSEERPGNRDRPATTPRRPDPARPTTREAGPEPRRRRTEGTRPPSQGNGRGLSGSPRNPNHYGEIPIRPDNSTFDVTHDRLVCIARNHVIPEDFPVQYRRMTASSRLEVVAMSGSDLLLCDHSHGGPHIWPDQTVVGDQPATDHQAASGEPIDSDSGTA